MVGRGPTKQEESLPHHHHGLASPGIRGQTSGAELGPGPGDRVEHPEIIFVLLGTPVSKGRSVRVPGQVSAVPVVSSEYEEFVLAETHRAVRPPACGQRRGDLGTVPGGGHGVVVGHLVAVVVRTQVVDLPLSPRAQVRPPAEDDHHAAHSGGRVEIPVDGRLPREGLCDDQ